MPRFSIQFQDGPQLDIEAESRERAWDLYKQRTGKRRGVLDPEPHIIEIPQLLADAPADLITEDATDGTDSGRDS